MFLWCFHWLDIRRIGGRAAKQVGRGRKEGRKEQRYWYSMADGLSNQPIVTGAKVEIP